jgi:class 3 adenylate cyclase
MALVRDRDHARRAVEGGLDLLAAAERFNRPRRVLGLRELVVRVGVSTGPVYFGNVGTPRKVDFTACGPTTNLAARLQGECRPGTVCISEATYGRVKDWFTCDPDEPQTLTLKGFGQQQVWFVTCRRYPLK